MVLKNIGIDIKAYVSQVGKLKLEKSYQELNLALAEENAVRCPDPALAQEMFDYIDEIGRAHV